MSLRLFNNPKKIVYVIIGFVLLFLLLLATASRGEASELYFDGGSTVARGYAATVGLNIKWPQAGPVKTDYEVGFLLTGESTYKERPQSNAFTLYGMLVDGYGMFEMGLGFAYTNAEWDYACHETAQLMAGLKFKRARIRYMHNSSAGSCKPNVGRDWLLASWRF